MSFFDGSFSGEGVYRVVFVCYVFCLVFGVELGEASRGWVFFWFLGCFKVFGYRELGRGLVRFGVRIIDF